MSCRESQWCLGRCRALWLSPELGAGLGWAWIGFAVGFVLAFDQVS